jgi:glycosyl transferase family 25
MRYAAPALAMQTFLVNLDAARDRRRRMQARLAHAGIAAQRVGIDLRGSALAGVHAWFAAHFPAMRIVPGALCSAEAGCWASHLVAWRRLLDSDAACCTVLEDDVVLAPGFAAAVAALHRSPTLDLVYLGTSSRNISTRRRTRIDAVWAHAPWGVIFNTWGYVISRAYVERLFAQRPFTIDMAIDHFLGGRARVARPRIGVLQPAVVSEDASDGPASQIQPYASGLRRPAWWQGARRALLASPVGDAYYALYRWL